MAYRLTNPEPFSRFSCPPAQWNPFAANRFSIDLTSFARKIVDFDHDLCDLWPVVFGNAVDDLQFALLRIDFEKVDLGKFVVADNIRHRGKPAFVYLAMKPLSNQLVDIFFQRLAFHRGLIFQSVPHNRANGFAVFDFIGMEAGEHGGLFIKGFLSKECNWGRRL